MDYVQLDKNTGDKRLRDACVQEGIVRCELLPKAVRDEPDDVVLEYIIAKAFVTFTFDRRIHLQGSRVLARRNPGILILRKDDDSLQQINTKTAPRHLQQLKSEFPHWNVVSYRNSVVEVTPTLVFVHHTLTELPVRTWWGHRVDAGWQELLWEHLAANAAGEPLAPKRVL